MGYRIREVDGSDDDLGDEITTLNYMVFSLERDPVPSLKTDTGYWWLVFHDGEQEPIAFAGLTPSTLGPGYGYLKRSGVLPRHRGHGLQKRLVRVREAKARRLGWHTLVTDTTSNVPSANNMIASGFRLFDPEVRWAFQNSLYWRKQL